MTNRPSGFYWIKRSPEADWIVAMFTADSDNWLVPGYEQTWTSSEFYKIGHEVRAPYDKQ